MRPGKSYVSDGGMRRTHYLGLGGAAFGQLVVLFAFVRGTFVDQLAPAALSTRELFTLAFLVGTWSTMVVLLVVNAYS